MTIESLIALFGGLCYLLIAGDILVRGALALARKTRISPMVVGLTVVAFGTSAPELFVSSSAVLQGLPAIAVGNVVGSNIANVLLVLGTPALIHTMACNQATARRDGSLMLGVSLIFAGMCYFGPLGKLHALVLLVLLAFYLVLALRSGDLEVEELDAGVDRVLGLPDKTRVIVLFFVFGLVGLQFGASLTIEGVVEVAKHLGVSEEVVALTAVALGTSLPELATTVIAALQRQSDVALGNVIGSIVFNLLAIMGVALLLTPAPVVVPAEMLRVDLPIMLGSALILALYTWRGVPIGFKSGLFFLAAYVGYIVVLFETR